MGKEEEEGGNESKHKSQTSCKGNIMRYTSYTSYTERGKGDQDSDDELLRRVKKRTPFTVNFELYVSFESCKSKKEKQV